MPPWKKKTTVTTVTNRMSWLVDGLDPFLMITFSNPQLNLAKSIPWKSNHHFLWLGFRTTIILVGVYHLPKGTTIFKSIIIYVLYLTPSQNNHHCNTSLLSFSPTQVSYNFFLSPFLFRPWPSASYWSVQSRTSAHCVAHPARPAARPAPGGASAPASEIGGRFFNSTTAVSRREKFSPESLGFTCWLIGILIYLSSWWFHWFNPFEKILVKLE